MDIPLFSIDAFKADPLMFLMAWILLITLIAAPFVYRKITKQAASESGDEATNESSDKSETDDVLLIDVERRGNRQFDRINKRYLPNGELVDEDEKFDVKRPNRKQLPPKRRD